MLTKLFGDKNTRELKARQPLVDTINSLEEGIRELSDDELQHQTALFKERLAQGETTDDILPEAFAVVREAAWRTLQQRHYDVQLVGGVVLHQGNIAEMRTGEGKTLVATLPAYLNALVGKGVHVITVNDYLSRRDAVWMGQIYAFLGLSVGVINSQNESFLYDPGHKEVDEERDKEGSFKVVYEFLRPCTKKEAYDADITYGTNNEFAFDYLRDNTAYKADQLMQRGFHYAVVDEIDSILIDEARTPLIISAPATDTENLYEKFTSVARLLKQDEDYEIDEKLRAITINDTGIEKAEKALDVDNIYTDAGIKYVHHLNTAVRAQALFQKDKEYVVQDGEVIIVDEFTGRLQPGRRWSEGLHQAIEAKEGLNIQQESRTFASVTFQNFFRMYDKLSGMTGTAETSAEEFFKVYALDTVVLPTNKTIQRIDADDLIFQSAQGKFKAIARKVKELSEKGQPVLIGTVSIENNELLSAHLKQEGVAHEILNAKNHEREGEIIADAGRKGAVTIATNMAGRGVDIKLGGTHATEDEYEEIKSLGGLFVLGTERHDARRIDNQLRGRSGRQGDPGGTQFFVSLEDDLMRIFATDMVKNMMGRLNIPEDEPIQNKIVTRSLETAQKKIEGFNFDARKRVLEFDDVLNKQRHTIYERRRTVLLGSTEEVQTLLQETIATEPDQHKQDTLSALVKDKQSALGEDVFFEAVRRLILQVNDLLWVEHLELMNYTRSSVNLRAYGQRDPLIEYKKEGIRLFGEMQMAVDEKICEMLPQIGAGAFEKQEEQLKKQREQMKAAGKDESTDTTKKPVIKRDEEKVGRNDPCPCGSGKKYKKCGLIGAPEHTGEK